mmetsp:Transcript_16887/g.41868  ORF Transcript_16887/g.41868 Transcript_16887/m.41868 type:complete len:207 (+) Transcript_16887:266-886(+)
MGALKCQSTSALLCQQQTKLFSYVREMTKEPPSCVCVRVPLLRRASIAFLGKPLPRLRYPCGSATISAANPNTALPRRRRRVLLCSAQVRRKVFAFPKAKYRINSAEADPAGRTRPHPVPDNYQHNHRNGGSLSEEAAHNYLRAGSTSMCRKENAQPPSTGSVCWFRRCGVASAWLIIKRSIGGHRGVAPPSASLFAAASPSARRS